MQIIIAASSILVIAGLAWAGKRLLQTKLTSRGLSWVCPVCVGVLLTWIGFLAAAYLGQPIDLTIPAVMMGGSVVGFTYYLEKKLNARRFINAWRVFFVVFGFVTVYALIREEWVWFVITAVVTLASVPVVIGLSKNNPNNNRPPEVARTAVSNTQSQQNIAAIRKKMEDCC